ncbi:discoidin domain-containing protein [Cellulomonas sp. GbtcB1]|uniref:galactose-binding domain-containing protein n=1 Tax=Cellulomonas sp. GbtcB1 TaxID=2824746 RepID=UPI001C2FA8BD|nr:discoidin domain-containing protein [Cellulomonas sp. GbtcB1]
MAAPAVPPVDPPPGAPAPAPRRRWGRRGVVLGLTAVLGASAGIGLWQLAAQQPGTGDGAVASAPTAGDPAARMCGVADPDRYAALAADAPVADVQDLADLGDAVPLQLAATGDHVAALQRDGGTTTIGRWTSAGKAGTPVVVDGGDDAPGSFALTTDGGVLATDGSAGGTTVALWAAGSADPSTTWDLAALDRGDVRAVLGWTAGRSGALATVVLADSHRLALLRADGTVDGDGPELEWGSYPRFYPQDDGSLVLMSDADDQSSSIALVRYAADGTPGLRIEGPLSGGSNGGAPGLDHPTGVATAADGGLLVAGPTWRLLEVGPDGVWRRQSLSGEGQGSTFRFADLTPFVRGGDAVYFASPREEGGGLQLSRVEDADLDLLLDAPIVWDVNHASSLDLLGFGAGLGTDATDDYFGPGTTPAVHAAFAPSWGALADAYELRYEVTGDPWLDPPVEATSGTVAIPADGGEVPLDLPAARPGPYEVHATLVEKATGAVRTATCLRYAVGADGATYDPASLAGGADWGGPGPLRGVQLAAQLGLGSHRVQLDFGRLVPDVTATPSAAGLDLAALPGAEDGDPFAGIDAAATLAADSDVQLYVQVGQGGEAEAEAVADGTWGAWVGVIAEALHAGAPDLHLWAPWNEPNNTGFGDGAAYATQVLTPFADAVRGADPRARVVGGNALNVVVPWYQQVVDAGGCASMDVVGIHPYTGFNRSWDEEGADGPIGQITALREVLAACGADVPVWDTESGWWSDGPANHWAQAYDVARSLLWMRELGVDEWMYFFSEGGWGEGGFTWSLVQLGSFVKPGALAMAAVSGVLDGRGAPDLLDTGDPALHAMAFGPATGAPSAAGNPAPAGTRDDPLLAVWTQDEVTEAQVTADAATTVTVTDVYGGTRTVDLAAGEPTPLPVTGSPVFLTADAALTVAPAADAGTDLLAGGTVTASSSTDGTDPADLVAEGGAGANPWRAGARTEDGPDASPWVQVDLASPATVDRVVVESAGIRCCTSGVRAYTVEVQDEDGAWQEVGRQDGLFLARTTSVTFEPRTVTAVRVQVPSTTTRGITVPDVNYSGQSGGLLPAWEPVQPEPTWPVSLVRLAAYGPAA